MHAILFHESMFTLEGETSHSWDPVTLVNSSKEVVRKNVSKSPKFFGEYNSSVKQCEVFKFVFFYHIFLRDKFTFFSGKSNCQIVVYISAL